MSSVVRYRPPVGRPTVRRSRLKNPILQAGACFAVAVVAAACVAWSGDGSDVLAAVAPGALAVIAGVLGALVLFRSSAVQRIYALQRRVKQLQDEVATLDASRAQVDYTIGAIAHFIRASAGPSPLEVIGPILETTAARLTPSLGHSVEIYVVHTSGGWHNVVAMAGLGRRGVGAGKMCSADRPLLDIIEDVAVDASVFPFVMEGQSHHLVLLADVGLGNGDRWLIKQIASLLELALREPRNVARLRAVR